MTTTLGQLVSSGEIFELVPIKLTFLNRFELLERYVDLLNNCEAIKEKVNLVFLTGSDIGFMAPPVAKIECDVSTAYIRIFSEAFTVSTPNIEIIGQGLIIKEKNSLLRSLRHLTKNEWKIGQQVRAEIEFWC